jgi:hypothetical protein
LVWIKSEGSPNPIMSGKKQAKEKRRNRFLALACEKKVELANQTGSAGVFKGGAIQDGDWMLNKMPIVGLTEEGVLSGLDV